MKKIIGVLLIILGLGLGLYVGGYIMFFGGIMDIISQIKAETTEASVIAWGVIKIVCASFIGGLSAFVFWLPGQAMITKG